MRTFLTAALLLLPCARLVAQLPPSSVPPQPVPVPPATQLPTGPPPPPTGLARWLNLSTAPFLPVPEIATDPNSGTTLGLLPVWLSSDAQHEIDRIIAPDVLHNTYFGYGMHARLYEYPSDDEQWSIVGGIKERVEREFDLEYQIGRARRDLWSFTASVIADTDGTPRFYGIGNQTPESSQTNYTARQELGRVQAGWNISHIWQLQYTLRAREVEVLPGTLSGIDSIQQLFGNATLGTGNEFLHRLSLIYDTRDDLTVPSHGMQWIAYSGVALSDALFNDQLYKEAGLDGRAFWPVFHDTVLAAHVALRYLISDHNAPFWALSTLGGETSDVGGEQTLRGFGAGRFTDRDACSTSVELRHNVFSFDAVSTRVDIEVAPFVDAGRVFSSAGTFPLSHLHTVGGVGFRGIAKPFVVGYVDVGYGSEGAAVFTGINYPF
jgi:outer membrane protein assembly factor BamA